MTTLAPTSRAKSKSCRNCRESFVPSIAKSMFWCSVNCRNASRTKSCEHCGISFVSLDGRARFCDVTCRNRALRGEADPFRNQRKCANRRGRMLAVVFERINPSEIFDRDAWTCYLCGTRVSRAGGQYSPTYPTLDHVTPLAKGGPHIRDNIRTACLRCNVRKGAA